MTFLEAEFLFDPVNLGQNSVCLKFSFVILVKPGNLTSPYFLTMKFDLHVMIWTGIVKLSEIGHTKRMAHCLVQSQY